MRDVVSHILRAKQAALLEDYVRLVRQEEMAEIKGAVEAKVEDPQVRQELSHLVTEVQRRQEELDAKIKAAGDEDARAVRKIELQKRRWEMRRSMLDREPAAVLIGGLLLVVIGVALLIAMFTHTAVPEIVSSAFLLILGFFFGQTTSSKGRSGDAG